MDIAIIALLGLVVAVLALAHRRKLGTLRRRADPDPSQRSFGEFAYLAAYFVGVAMLSSAKTTLRSQHYGRAAALVAGAIAVGSFGLRGHQRARRRRIGFRQQEATRQLADTPLHDPNAPPPVLYLRSFLADELAERTAVSVFHNNLAFESEEEQLTSALSSVGPVLAIGNPGESIPTLGAARVYFGDDEWQEAVATLLRAAALVVVRAGPTENVFWEFQRARSACAPERLVLLVPRSPSELEPFLSRCQTEGISMPNIAELRATGLWAWLSPASAHGLLYFTQGWNPHFVKFKFWQLSPVHFRSKWNRPFFPMFHTALRPVFQQIGAPWKPSPISWVAVSAWLAGGGTFVVMSLSKLLSNQ